jgi:hypothetical protein
MTQDNKGYQSSENYQPTGVTVLSGGGASFNREVQTADDLNDNDLINVAGMQVTAKQARELGLLGQVFDEGLNAGSARKRTETPEPMVDTVKKSDTGYATYDEAIDKLNVLIDEGSMTAAEGQVYYTSLAEIAFAGLQVDHVVETLSGLADGSIAEADVPADVRAMATHVETEVRQASTKAAINELGKPAFDRLSEMASAHAGVAQVVERYAIDRAQGKHGGITWSELYQDLNEQLGNT